MLKYYLSRIVAQLWRRKLYSLISIVSLTVGLAVFSLIFLHVKWELSYDRLWPDSGRIHRVLINQSGMVGVEATDTISVANIEKLPAYLDELIEAAAIIRSIGVTAELESRTVNLSLKLTDNGFTRVFRPELIAGDLEKTLQQPAMVALDEELAVQLFGSAAQAMGNRITFAGGSGFSVRDGQATQVQGENQEYQVSAIYRLPRPVSNATQFSALTMDGEYSAKQAPFSGNAIATTWLKLKPAVQAATVNQSLPSYVSDHFQRPSMLGPDQNIGDVYRLRLEPLHDIYFHSATLSSAIGGDLTRVITFSIIGLLVLLAGCTNAVSISLAGILDRTREVGILKAIGAQQGQLTLQYMGEAQVLTLLALIPTLIATKLLHPAFAQLLSLRELPAPGVQEAVMITAIALVVGLIIGLYPALVLARQKPVESLKGRTEKKQASLLNLRTLLVGAQFTFAMLLLVGTLALYTQLLVARAQPLGFDQDNLLSVSSAPFTEVPADDVLINALGTIPGVQKVAAVASLPRTNTTFVTAQELIQSMTDAEGVRAIQSNVVHEHFALLEIPVIAGREFDLQRDTAELQAQPGAAATGARPGEPMVFPPQRALVNRVATRALGYNEPGDAVGKRIYARTDRGAVVILTPLDIIGVVEDSMYASLRSRPGAEYYVYSWGTTGARINASLMLRYDDAVEETIGDRVREAWTLAAGTGPAYVSFIESQIEAVYRQEQRESTLLLICAGMALLLSTIGLYGLVSVAMKTQIKEIGVRKVLGASRARIVGIFLYRFAKPMLPATLIAWPVAVYFVLQWIERFPYQMDKIWLLPICLAGSTLVLLVSCGTVALLSARAAGTRPTQCLRYE